MSPLKPHELLDAMPETKRYFVRRLKRCPIDVESFMVRLGGCTLESCQGTCCYDGVCLDEDEERYVSAVVGAHPKHFAPLGVTAENAFEDSTFLGVDTRKTRTRPFRYRKHVGFPAHFERTACVFRDGEGRCSLQTLAMEHGEHPWAYKPLSCWLHPISLERGNRTMIWLPRMGSDPLTSEGYPGYAPYTHCGRECSTGTGRPAFEVLKWELETLGAIVERDVWGEIARGAGARQEAATAE